MPVLVGASAAMTSRAKCELQLCSASSIVLMIRAKSMCVDVEKVTCWPWFMGC